VALDHRIKCKESALGHRTELNNQKYQR